MYIDNPAVLIVLLGLLAYSLVLVYRWLDGRASEIAKLDDGASKLELKVDLFKAAIQAVAAIGIGVAAVLSWFQFAQADNWKQQIESTRYLSEILRDLKSQEPEIQIPALLALENLAVRKPRYFRPLLEASLLDLDLECPQSVFIMKKDLTKFENMARDIASRYCSGIPGEAVLHHKDGPTEDIPGSITPETTSPSSQ